MVDDRDYYVILGVPPDASGEAIRAARRARLRELHPDVNRDDPRAEERFDEICKICEVLGDPIRRMMYDRMLRASREGSAETSYEGRTRCTVCGGAGTRGFVTCGWCMGLGRNRFGFSSECSQCEGSGRQPLECPVCDGKGWRSAPSERTPPKQSPPPPRTRRQTARTFYDVLGVSPDASAARIDDRYRALVGAHGKTAALQEIKLAYRRIGDPRRRGGYDRAIGRSPSLGSQDDMEVRISRRCAREGGEAVRLLVRDAEPCPECEGLACPACGPSGWTAVDREIACPIRAGSGDGDRITVRDELLGVITFRLRLALVPSFLSEPGGGEAGGDD